ncbi:MAG: hypothetical protein WBE90_25435 [Xanthobacteraceae bacterium]
MMIGISTGYRRAGLMYQKHRDHFGQDSDDCLVVQGSTQQFNQTVDMAALDALRAADPAAAPSGMARSATTSPAFLMTR